MAVPVVPTGAGNYVETAYTSATTFVGTKPANTADGDLLLAVVYTRNGSADFTAPSGWVPVPTTVSPAQTVGVLRVYALPVPTASAISGTTSWTWTTANGASRSGIAIMRVTGADLAAYNDSAGNWVAATASDLTLPSDTTVAANTLLLAVMTASASAAVHYTPPAGMTLVDTLDFGTGTTWSTLDIFRENRPTAGATGTRVFTQQATISSGAGYLVALKGAAASNTPPTANAGADQTNVEPWVTVTLTGTDSDSDGTIASRAWTQTGGSPTVTLSGSGATRTFAAPGAIAGTTLTFQYAATDNAGATTTDTMTVAVLPVTERAVIGGVEVPMQIRAT